MPSRSSRSLRAPAASRIAVILVTIVMLFGCGRRVGEGPERDGGPLGAMTAATPVSSAQVRGAPSGEGWNAAQIDWQPYEAGLARAKEQNKPVCLVFYTTWCPHCRNYSHVFEDQRVVARARDFVMVHLDADKEESVASKYALDGTYIPRTFFLAPNGTLDGSIHAPRPSSRYFYDERDPGSLLAAMETAHQRLVN
ncbi:MAG: thioredoxin family protein [Polyangiaceae bacterium]|jgi:thiol:disulfide interchange protein